MEISKFMIDGVPAVIYGVQSKKCYLFLHGKNGNKEEARDFAEFAEPKGWQVLAIDLPEHGERKNEESELNPWTVIPELKIIISYMSSRWDELSLRANSIGAWLAMNTFSGNEFKKALFVSPVLDMPKLIENMMAWAGVSAIELKDNSEILTDFGEKLSWKYYQYSLDNPIQWNCNTYVLYGSLDNLTDKEAVENFCNKHSANLFVMDKGEHWFHTTEQVKVLNDWTADCLV